MVRFECVRVSPTAEELASLLANAAARANEGAPRGPLTWPPAGLAEELAAVFQAPEGSRQWVPGPSHPVPYRDEAGVALAWWTDRLGRRHLRIVGRVGGFDRRNSQAVLGMAGEYVHLALVYPERALLRDQGNRRLIWALCDCGCFGPPEALGWMGPCCGPCHDRGEEGAQPPPGPRTALRCSGVDVAGLAWWGADGSTIVSRAQWEKARVWRPHTGTVEELPCPERVSSLASAPAQGLLAYSAAGRLHVLGPNGRRQELAGPGDNVAHNLAFSPDGSLLAAGGDRGLIVWRLADCRALLEGHNQTQVIGFAFGGKALATYEPRAGARLRYPTTGQSMFLVRLPRRPNLGDLTLSLDGRWLVAGGWDGKDFHFWRLDRSVVALPDRKLPPRRQGGGLAFAPDSPVMAYLGTGKGAHFWDVEGARDLGTLRLLGPPPSALAFSPDGRTLAVGFEGGVVLWPWRELLGADPTTREA